MAVRAVLKGQTHVLDVLGALSGKGAQVAFLAVNIVMGALERKTRDVVIEETAIPLP